MSNLFGGAKANASSVPIYTQLSVQTSTAGLCIPIVWGTTRCGTNLIWKNDFEKHASSSGGKGGKGGGGGGKGGGTTYTYSTALILAICEGPIQGVSTVWVNQGVSTLSSLNLTLFTGTLTQTPPSWITSKYPSEAQPYSGTAYLFSSKYDLQSSAAVPSHNFEVSGTFAGTVPYTTDGQDRTKDANVADIIKDYLTNSYYGLDPSLSGVIHSGSWDDYKTYCQAQSLVMSPYLNMQEQAQTTLERWATLTNTWIFWSGTAIKFIPLTDSPVTDGNVTYTPNVTPVYDLTYDDFVFDATSEDPITLTRSDPRNGYNRVEVDYSERLNDYNSTPSTWQDDSSVFAYGELQANIVQASEVCMGWVAATMAQLIGRRLVGIRNTYQFKLGYNFILLEPGDILTLTDANLGLNKFGVRIQQIQEDENQNLLITAEEFVAGTGVAAAYSVQTNAASAPPDLFADPGNVNSPAILEPSPVVTNGQSQLWVGLSGGAEWGGADIYVSADGTNYAMVGQVSQPTQQGTLTAGLPDHTDPDSVNTLTVDLTISGQSLATSTTSADADNFTTASLIDGEIVSYGTATLTGTNTYSLTYLRRGVYNTGHAAHSTGALFSRLNPAATFVYQLPQQWVGVELYFKFTSFNRFGNSVQDISSVSAYTYTPSGPSFTISAPTSPVLTANLTVQPDGTAVIGMTLAWVASAGPSLGSYDIQFSTDGGTTWATDNSAGASATSFTLAPAIANTTYTARVRAISQNGMASSSWATSSSVSSGTTSSAVPSMPTGFTVTPGVGSASLSWATNPVAESVQAYKIYRATGLSQPFSAATLLATTNSLNYVDNGLAQGSTWTYFLVANNVKGDSANTAGVNATINQMAITDIASTSLDITSTGSTIDINLGTLTAGTLLGNPGTAGAVPSAVSIGPGLALNSGFLDAEWSAGTVAAVGGGLDISGGTIEAQWAGGTVTALGTNLSITGGTLNAVGGGGSSEWSAGTVTAIGSGITLTSGTISASGGGSSGALTLILTQFATGVAELDFTIDTSSYDYELVLRDVEAASTSSVGVEFATGSPATYKTTGYYWTGHWSTVGISTVSSGSGSNGAAQFFGSGSVNFPRTAKLFVSGAGYTSLVSWQTATAKTAGVLAQYLADGTVLTGIRVRSTSGNFTGGSASLYRWAR